MEMIHISTNAIVSNSMFTILHSSPTIILSELGGGGGSIKRLYIEDTGVRQQGI